MALTAGELAHRFDLELRGDPSTPVEGVCALSPGQPGCIAYLADPKLRAALAQTRAGVVIVGRAHAEAVRGCALVARDPAVAYARIAAQFDDSRRFEPGVDPLARVHALARLGAGCHVGVGAVIEAEAELGAGVFVGPGCVVGRAARIGTDCRLEARVWIGPRCRLGERVRIEPGAVIGSRGFGLARAAEGWLEIPQLGAVRVGNDVEVGANTTIDRGTFDDTVIGDGVKLDNQIQIGHNCTIGPHTAIAACVGIAGSTHIGARVLIGGAAGINGHLSIGDDSALLAGTMVTKDIPARQIVGGALPHQSARSWRRMMGLLRNLEGMLARIRALEKRVGVADANDTGESLESEDL